MLRLKELMECLIISAMDSQHGKENKPKDAARAARSVDKERNSHFSKDAIDDLTVVNSETLKMRLTKSQFSQVSKPDHVSACHPKKGDIAVRLSPASTDISVRDSPRVGDGPPVCYDGKVPPLQTANSVERRPVRQNTEDDDDVRYERIHSWVVAISDHQARLAPDVASGGTVGNMPSQTSRRYPPYAGDTAEKMCCNRTSSIDRTTSSFPDVVHQCFNRSHQFPSRKTQDTAENCRHVQLDPCDSRCNKNRVNRTGNSQLLDGVVTHPEHLPDGDVIDGEHQSNRRRIRTLQRDENFRKRPLSEIITNDSEKSAPALRRQGRFVGRRFQHAELSVRMHFWNTKSDGMSSDIDELHPVRPRCGRRWHRRRQSRDRTISSTTTIDETASCLDRGFLVTGNTSDDDRRVSGLSFDHRRFRRQQCAWDPDISPIGRHHSVAIDRTSKCKLEIVERDRSPHFEKSTEPMESMEKIDRKTDGLHQCEDAATGSSVGDTVMRYIDEKTAPKSSESPGTVVTEHPMCSAKTTNKWYFACTASSADCRCKLIHDIIDCESSFVRQMSLGAERFSRPMRRSPGISYESWSKIFQNIEKLTALSQYHLQLMLDHNSCVDRAPNGTVRLGSSVHGNHHVGIVYRPTVRLLLEAYHQYQRGLPNALLLVQRLRCSSDVTALNDVNCSDDFDLEQFLSWPIEHLLTIRQRLTSLLKSTSDGDDEDNEENIALQFVILELNRELECWT